MMDPSEINSFEDSWKKALQDASEIPPRSVWDKIEGRLDEDDHNGVVPLWWQSPKRWYAAASVIAFLLIGGGIWYTNSSESNYNVASQTAVKNNSANQPPAASPSKAAAGMQPRNEALAIPSKEGSARVATTAKSSLEKLGNRKAMSIRNKLYAARQFDIRHSKASEKNRFGKSGSSPFQAPVRGSLEQLIPMSALGEVLQQEITVPEDPLIIASLLSAIPFNELDVHFQKRYVFFRPELKSEEAVKKLTKHQEYWAGIGIMPASFNPDVKVKTAPMAFANQSSVASKKSVLGSSTPGTSYAVQTQGGVRIARHWSIEMGLSYLQGNSGYEGGGYVVNPYSRSANVLENALAGIGHADNYADKDGAPAFLNSGSVYVDVNKKVSNNYQYLQLPLQAGFTLNPEGKVSYALLGGMMANVFLSNELESASGEIITTTSDDEIYRNTNWSATTGLRFSYRLSSKWKASLTGSYQKAVSSGFKSNQSLNSHPYLYGLAWGVRYSF